MAVKFDPILDELRESDESVEISGGLVPKGAYSASTNYAVGDSVDYQGSSYVMYADAPAGTAPTDTDYWQVLAEKGDTGAQGPQGDPGPNEVTTSTSTNITGLLKGNGSVVSGATADTDYLTPGTAASTYQPVGSYLTSESDPVFSASEAANITSTDITNLGNLSGTNTGDQTATDFDIKDLTDSTSLRTTWSGKQDALVSGTNIKTINSGSILGSGNISLQTPLVADTDYLTPGTAASTYEPLLGFTPEDTANKGVANGYAPLNASGKIASSYLDPIAITSTSVVASEAAQLALTAQEGDIAVRSDENKSYVHNGGTAGDMTDWTLLLTPTDAVLSVDGQTGAVDLSAVYEPKNANIQSHISSTSNPHSVTKTQVGLGNVENTALSTWTGSTNITTLGTIGTGVWQGTDIADAYIASAATWNAKQDAITWGDGLEASGATASVDYNTTNLKITSDKLNTIQDIATSSSPTFAGLKTTGSIYIGDTANAKNTLGLTVNQSDNDDEILSLKSSDVAHSFTTNTEADTFGFLSKLYATSTTKGGLRVVGLTEGDGAGLQLEGWIGSNDPTDTTPAINLVAAKLSGTTKAQIAYGERALRIQNNTLDLLTLTGNGFMTIAGDMAALNYKFLVPGGSTGGLYYYNSTLGETKWWESYDAPNDSLKWYHYADDGSYDGLALQINSSKQLIAPYTYYATVGATNRDLYIDDTGLIGYVSSTLNVKENITDVTEADTSWIYKLRPRKYDRKDGSVTGELGLIAEEVEMLNIPRLVSYARTEKVEQIDKYGIPTKITYGEDKDVPETVNYSRLIVPLLIEVQRLKAEITALKGTRA